MADADRDAETGPGAGLSDQALAEWVVTTALLFGASVATAYQVAGLFVQAARQSKER